MNAGAGLRLGCSELLCQLIECSAGTQANYGLLIAESTPSTSAAVAWGIRFAPYTGAWYGSSA